jgi:hypothetical protein
MAEALIFGAMYSSTWCLRPGKDPHPTLVSHPACLMAALHPLSSCSAAFALPRPDALSPLPLQSLLRAHNSRRYGHLSPAVLADRGGAFGASTTPIVNRQ